MHSAGLLQIVIFCIVVTAGAVPLGRYMAHVYEGERTWLSPILGPVERGLYRVCGIDPTEEMAWTTYAKAMLVFNLLGIVVVYVLQHITELCLPANMLFKYYSSM